jgi:L-amino acid N-acyltransferase YncA
MPAPEVQIRPFAACDAEVLGPWLDAPGVSLPPGGLTPRWAERLLADGRVRAFVATENGVPVGFARLDIGPDRLAELTIAVARSRRQRGVGARLLELVADQAKKLGIRRLHAVVDESNRPACAFFERVGFEEQSVLPLAVTFVRWIHDATAVELEIDSGS